MFQFYKSHFSSCLSVATPFSIYLPFFCYSLFKLFALFFATPFFCYSLFKLFAVLAFATPFWIINLLYRLLSRVNVFIYILSFGTCVYFRRYVQINTPHHYYPYTILLFRDILIGTLAFKSFVFNCLFFFILLFKLHYESF